MATSIKNGELVTAGSTNDTEVQIVSSLSFIGPVITAFIEVVSGTVQFSSGEAITPQHRAWATGSKFPMSFENGENLHFKAASANDTFVITI
jgi:hypothetical protein